MLQVRALLPCCEKLYAEMNDALLHVSRTERKVAGKYSTCIIEPVLDCNRTSNLLTVFFPAINGTTR